MRRWWLVGGAVGVGLLGALAARIAAERSLEAAWDGGAAGPDAARFEPEMVAGLPGPARRLLLHAIAPGTPLATSVELAMAGTIRLRPGADPLPMRAEQVIRLGRGFVWKARVGDGPVRIRGYDRFYDEVGEMRWWLLGVVPVVSEAGADFDRSAAGRLAAETVLLVPSLLLPVAGAEWEAVDLRSARVRLPWTGETEPVHVEVDDVGRLVRLSLRRWNGDPAHGAVGRIPFIADALGHERTFGGYTIPTTVRAGWRTDEPDGFAFFHASIERAVYR
jgi:hypothetical protein